MTLFDDIARDDPSPASETEGHYAFLNRVATPYWGRVRSLLSEWVTRLPQGERDDTIARMRSKDRRQSLAAFWELYLLITFQQLGFGVVQHPRVPNSTRRPDFLIETDRGVAYVEATLASTSDEDLAKDNRRRQVYDTINNGLHTPDFWLALDLDNESDEAPGIRKHLPDVQAWLDEQDANAIEELLQAKSYDILPRYRITDRGWTLTITPLAKGGASRGDATARPIGFYPFEGGSFDGRAPVLAALNEKTSRYGVLDAPYMIAVLVETFLTDHDDVYRALFGNTTVVVPVDDPDESVPGSVPDGFWLSDHGPTNTHVSAVVTARELYEWRVAEHAPVVWVNPWADQTFPADLPWTSHSISGDGNLDTSEPGTRPFEIFDLPPEWPGPEGPFDIE